MQLDKGNCCGSSCTELTVLDNVTVLYFDDVYFDNGKNVVCVCASAYMHEVIHTCMLVYSPHSLPLSSSLSRKNTLLVRDDTRRCNNCKTFCCGGRGEQVQIESTFCCGLCLRGRTPMTCIPSCCPEACCPCIAKVSIFSQGVCFKKCRMYDLHKR
uniref:Uncharacterized protein n=1 Tax=Ditylum brightwellii TaxID=49249 RepID=A0A6V2HAJ3_9STRA